MAARSSRPEMCRRLNGCVRAVLVLLLPVSSHAQDVLSELDDAAARMQYAYYTDDIRTLEDVLVTVASMEEPSVPGLKEYFSAYGQWKLAQLYADALSSGKPTGRGTPAKAAQECQRQAKSALVKDARLAEAHAIQSICSGTKSGGTDCSAKPLRTALEMDPQNPRIGLIELLCVSGKDLANSNTLQRARALVSAFESAPPSRPGKPDWGQAEALVLLGQIYLQRGDLVAARNTIERALVLAPDYRKAQELLQATARSK